ncbi:MAG: flippase-like domain-containing protein [Gemmataceae bacterium]|nr:flippase-like domain-containing protein [Gemmataceae bacterium]
MSKWIRLAFGLGIFALVAARTNWADFQRALTNLRVEWWLAAVGILAVSLVFSAYRWQRFAEELKFDRPFAKYVGYYFVGMFFNLFLPTSVGGDVVRAWYLDNRSGRKLAAFASVFLDRVNGLGILVMLACVASLASPVPRPMWVDACVWGLLAAGFAGMIALPFVARMERWSPNRARQLRTMVDIIHHPVVLVQTTIVSVIVQIANVVIVWCLVRGLDLDISITYLGIVVPIISLLTMLPVSLNGMGIREGAMALFLIPLGVAESSALTLSLLWFSVYLAVGLLGGGVYLLGSFARPAEMPDDANEESDTEEPMRHGSFDHCADQGRAGQLKDVA